MTITMPAEQGARRTITVRAVAFILVAVAAYDGAGLLAGGPAVTSSPSYAVLSLVPGGMRTWGVLLLALAVALAWAIGQDRSRPTVLNRVLAAGVGYYALWTVLIPLTWMRLDLVPAWGAPSKTAALMAFYYLCARAVAPGASPWARLTSRFRRSDPKD